MGPLIWTILFAFLGAACFTLSRRLKSRATGLREKHTDLEARAAQAGRRGSCSSVCPVPR